MNLYFSVFLGIFISPVVFFVTNLYYWFQFGQTLGKRLLEIRVVTVDGRKPSVLVFFLDALVFLPIYTFLGICLFGVILFIGFDPSRMLSMAGVYLLCLLSFTFFVFRKLFASDRRALNPSSTATIVINDGGKLPFEWVLKIFQRSRNSVNL